MILIEKIGQLILVTLEGHISKEDTESVKKQLKELAAVEDDEAVVSLSFNSPNGSQIPQQDKASYNEIIEFCNKSNIRIYSYISEE